MSIRIPIAAILVCALLLSGCKKPDIPVPEPQVPQNTASTVPVYGYEIINTYPHDAGAFTEGLQYVSGFIYEGTGLEGKSALRKVDLKTGKVLKEYTYPADVFGEGITLLGNKIYQLSYQTQKGYIFDANTFSVIDSFKYIGEGWGMTTDGTSLIMSNGTNTIQYLDPNSLTVTKKIEVIDGVNPLMNINELELVKGELITNIWQTNRLAIIDLATGKVKAYVDLSGILPESDRTLITDVLNGIAYDEKGDRLFVTGKLWRKLFEIKIKRTNSL